MNRETATLLCILTLIAGISIMAHSAIRHDELDEALGAGLVAISVLLNRGLGVH